MSDLELGQNNNKSAQTKASSVLSGEKLSSTTSGMSLNAMDEAKLKAKIKKRSKINNFLNKYFHFIIIIIVLLILTLAYFYIIKPKYFKAMEAIEGNLSSQKEIYLEQLTKLNNYKSLVNAYKKVSPAEIEKINSILPTKYEKEQLFIELGYVIPENGFQLNNLTITEKKTDDEEVSDPRARRDQGEEVSETDFLQKLPKGVGYIMIDLDIALVDYKNFKRLLNILENNIKLLDIYKLSFNPSSESAQISAVSYYLEKNP